MIEPQSGMPHVIDVAGCRLEVDLVGDAHAIRRLFDGVRAPATQGTVGRLTVRVDDAEVAAVVDRGGAPGHHRHGDVHLWTTVQPPMVQRFEPMDQARLELVLSTSALYDGAVRARPALQALSACVAAHGATPIHASAIARDGLALLLLGPGGTGKTTTALALAERGWGILSDDRCFLRPNATGVDVHAMYPTALLTPTSYQRLGAHGWPQLGASHEGKRAVGFPSHMTFVARARVAAVVVLRASSPGLDSPVPLTRRERLHAWWSALSHTMHAHVARDAWLPTLGRLMPSMPAFAMGIDWDFGRMDAALSSLVGSLRASSSNVRTEAGSEPTRDTVRAG